MAHLAMIAGQAHSRGLVPSCNWRLQSISLQGSTRCAKAVCAPIVHSSARLGRWKLVKFCLASTSPRMTGFLHCTVLKTPHAYMSCHVNYDTYW